MVGEYVGNGGEDVVCVWIWEGFFKDVVGGRVWRMRKKG